MKYLEELEPGITFIYQNIEYIISTDFKKNNSRMCISLQDGSIRWLSPSDTVELVKIYKIDENNNIIDLQPTKKESLNND